MTIEDYFKDWLKVLDKTEIINAIKWLKTLNPVTLCPSIRNVFKAFEVCPYEKCKVVFIFQDPYPQKGVATGIALGNKLDSAELSPSLQVIKNSVINFKVSHNLITFDPTLESWARQGILMLNSSLTTEVGKIGIHIMKWRNFMIAFLKQMSLMNPGTIYVLFGNQAQVLEPYINKNNYIFKVKHPAYFVRNNMEMSSKLWEDINTIFYSIYGEKIEWFKEESVN